MNNTNLSKTIFISHTHADKEIADALRDAVRDIFGNQIGVHYSTSKELEGGIKAGEDWFKWITKEVHSADFAFILLTPASIQKPWIIWESGAVFGVALASNEEDLLKVRPLVFQLGPSDVPSPFQRIQTTRGDKIDEMQPLFLDIIRSTLSSGQAAEAGVKLNNTLETYCSKVNEALLNAPLLPTEAAVQEWALRLENLRSRKRLSEIEHLHDWLNISFGRETLDHETPIDLRLHRILGESYLASKNYKKAAEQFELARRLAPRDIFVLRSLGQAYLGKNDFEEVRQIIDRIKVLDENAFSHNIECATLKGRLHRQQGDLQSAVDTYKASFERNPTSYYLADVLAQCKLELGMMDEAKQLYERALKIIEDLKEHNIWTHATAATAAIATDKEDVAIEHLKTIRNYDPTSENIASIERGLDSVMKSIGLDEAKCLLIKNAIIK